MKLFYISNNFKTLVNVRNISNSYLSDFASKIGYSFKLPIFGYVHTWNRTRIHKYVFSFVKLQVQVKVEGLRSLLYFSPVTITIITMTTITITLTKLQSKSKD